MSSPILRCGKYSGSSLDEVFQKDYSYLQWLSHERPPWAPMEEIDLLRIDPNDYRMKFGKHNGLMLSTVKKIDQRYFKWLIEKVDEIYDKKLCEAIRYYKD